jgi:glucose/arabinose dehydrogenase
MCRKARKAVLYAGAVLRNVYAGLLVMKTHTRSYARSLVVSLFSISAVFGGCPRDAAAAVTLPPGFVETLVAAVTDPTAMQFAPDGRLFVCEQRGTLRVFKDGALLPTPFVSLTVNFAGERGLLGVAFDPAFAVNQYVYVYYTATTPTLHNRVSRFTANGDVAVPGSEVVIFDLPLLGTAATNHNGGALNFGADGKLYIAVGDYNVPSNAQSLNTTFGKMLRINPDGSIPADNPFFGVTTGQNRAIWALGLRNPFTFAFDSAGTRMFINDVGELNWEEINDGIAGANYGWPATEGYTTNPSFTSPVYAYDHPTGCAITGGAFYLSPTNQFPSSYDGVYFFTDICGFFIKMLDPVSGTVTPFATGIIYPVALAVSPTGDLYYLDRDQGGLHRISYTLPLPATVTADSVTPASGTGAAQTFAFRYSNSSGAANFMTAFALFSGMSGDSCLVHYDRMSNMLGLLNDAGTQYLSGRPGGSGTLTTSRCTITLGSSSVALSGNTVTLNLAMTFAPAFAGAKTVYLYGANTAGANSGWRSLGAWTVPAAAPGPAPVVTADSVVPSSGTGFSQTFALQASDTTGAGNLQMMFFWFTASPTASPASSCLAYYDRPSNTLGLLNDAATQYARGMAGASATISNSQCAIALGSTTAVTNGNSLTLNVPITFASAFAGAKDVILYAANASGVNSGWPMRGTWTVPAGPGPGPAPGVTADSILPASGSGPSQTFAMQFSDSSGAMNLSTAFVLFMGSGGGSCLAYFHRMSNTVGLLNDAGTQYISGMPGAAGTLANSRCAIALASTSAMLSGNTLTLNLATAFAAPFAGAMNIYLYAANAAGLNSGWQSRGTWTASGAAPPAGVTADSVMPASGTGASQVFAVQLSDSAGAMNLSTVFVLFSGISGGSCLVYYDRPSNIIGLLNDAGTQYAAGMVGGSGMLINSRCALALGSTMAMPGGNSLTLNVAMTFAPAFAGAKNVYLYGANAAGMNSGWQMRGTWTVP